jgi:hypothetical protein
VTVSVGALESDFVAVFGHRHHGQAAALAFPSSVGQKVNQAPADLLETDAFCCFVPYTSSTSYRRVL